jgi:hypothetical protein
MFHNLVAIADRTILLDDFATASTLVAGHLALGEHSGEYLEGNMLVPG